MKQFILLGRCAFVGMLALMVTATAFAAPFYIAPHLQNITKDGATLIWETAEPSTGAIAYGKGGKLDGKVEHAEPMKIHRLRITGLEPETEYSYKVDSGGATQENVFKTAPATSRETTFVVFGDTRRWEAMAEETKVLEHAMQWKPEFFVNNGDLVRAGHNYALWPEHFSRFASITSRYMMVTSRGNHEGTMGQDVENDWFAKYHELPGEGEPFAAFDWGNTHFELVSYEQTKDSGPHLDEHLSKSTAQYNILSHHFTIYCTGYYSPTDERKEPGKNFAALAQICDKYKIAVDIAGHTHIYERSFPIREDKRNDSQGTVYVVNGGDINANFGDWWTAVGDDPRRYSKPTYTVFFAKNDRLEFRSFAWDKEAKQMAEIDHVIRWNEESLPQGVVASLATLNGAELAAAVEQLGAMHYGPAADAIVKLLDNSDAAVRRAAAKALRFVASPALSATLVKYLADADLEVRLGVASALEVALDPAQAEDVAKAAVDSAQDERTRMALIGALKFHAPAELAKKSCLTILEQSSDPEWVRTRAASALGSLTEMEDVKTLVNLFEVEQQGYVLIRLGYILTKVTGARPEVEMGQVGSMPEKERKEIGKVWLKAARKA